MINLKPYSSYSLLHRMRFVSVAEELLYNKNFTSGKSELVKHKDRQLIIGLITFTALIISFTAISLPIAPTEISNRTGVDRGPTTNSSTGKKDNSPKVLGATASKKESTKSAVILPTITPAQSDLSVKTAGVSAQTNQATPTTIPVSNITGVSPTPIQIPSVVPTSAPLQSPVPQVTPQDLVNGLIQNVNGVVGGLLNSTH